MHDLKERKKKKKTESDRNSLQKLNEFQTPSWYFIILLNVRVRFETTRREKQGEGEREREKSLSGTRSIQAWQLNLLVYQIKNWNSNASESVLEYTKVYLKYRIVYSNTKPDSTKVRKMLLNFPIFPSLS